jgi:hypothetical protein
MMRSLSKAGVLRVWILLATAVLVVLLSLPAFYFFMNISTKNATAVEVEDSSVPKEKVTGSQNIPSLPDSEETFDGSGVPPVEDYWLYGLVDGEYPINENGQTYGIPTPYNNFPEPDLIPVIATNGACGYSYNEDLDYGFPKKDGTLPPDEELLYGSYIPVYELDGTTVIGQFWIGGSLDN